MYLHTTMLPVLLLLIGFARISSSASKGQGCFYNGQFRHGNWTDGCDFRCTCQNSETGHYKCTVRCPIYRSLPKGCVLKLPPGEECCKEPDCASLTTNYNIKHGTSNNTPLDTSADVMDNKENSVGCLYKGKYYTGSWNDGCEQTCTCDNVVSGQYTCRKRCVNYTNVPRECDLKLPPGEECCKEVFCNEADPSKQNIPIIREFHKSKAPFHSFRGGSGREVRDRKMINANSMKQMQKAIQDFRPYERLFRYNFRPKKDRTILNSLAKERNRVMVDIFSNYGPLSLFETNKSDMKSNVDIKTSFNRAHKFSNNYGNNMKPEMVFFQHNTIKQAKRVKTRSSNSGLTKISTNKGMLDLTTKDKHNVTNNENGRSGYCVFQEKNYSDGDMWHDGCKKTCFCENASAGTYTCHKRCPEYGRIPTECSFKINPVDPCCKIPDCHDNKVIPINNPDSFPWMLAKFRNDNTRAHILKESFNERVRTRFAKLIEQIPEYMHIGNKMFKDKRSNEKVNLQNSNVAGVKRGINELLVVKQGLIDEQNLQNKEAVSSSTDSRYRHLHVLNESVQLQELNVIPVYKQKKGILKRKHSKLFPSDYLDTNNQLVKTYKLQPVINRRSANVMHTTTGKSSSINLPEAPINSTGHCIHKGVMFSHGQTWNDGCKLLCTCGFHGQVTCNKRCYHYEVVPLGCHLTYPHGKHCCQILVCAKKKNKLNTQLQSLTQIPLKSVYSKGSKRIIRPGNLFNWKQQFLKRTQLRPSDVTVTSVDSQNKPGLTQSSNIFSKRNGLDSSLDVMKIQRIYAPPRRLVIADSWHLLHPQPNTRHEVEAVSNTIEESVRPNNIKRRSRTASGNYSERITRSPVNENKLAFPVSGLTFIARPNYLTTINKGNIISSKEIENNAKANTRGTTPALPNDVAYGNAIYAMSTGDITNSKVDSNTNLFGMDAVSKVSSGIHYTTYTMSKDIKADVVTLPRFVKSDKVGKILGCLVKGKLLRQGESLKVDCKQRCTCDDDRNHRVTCKPLCVRWKLPAACILEPPSVDSCCHTPKCPKGYEIRYPNGFSPE